MIATVALRRPEEPGPGSGINLTYPAVPESVPLARAAAVRAARRAGFPVSRHEAIRLAVSEAVTNAVRHAYPDERPGEVRLSVSVLADELVVLIEDDGCGPHRTSVCPGLGWGWAIIAAASDEFTVGRGASAGTRACLHFRAGA